MPKQNHGQHHGQHHAHATPEEIEKTAEEVIDWIDMGNDMNGEESPVEAQNDWHNEPRTDTSTTPEPASKRLEDYVAQFADLGEEERLSFAHFIVGYLATGTPDQRDALEHALKFAKGRHMGNLGK